MHDVAIDFLGAEEAEASISGHAELWRNGTMIVTALRYADKYRRTLRGWRFAEREIASLHYVPLADCPGILGVTDRNRAYCEPRPADFPEALPSWKDYERSAGRN